MSRERPSATEYQAVISRIDEMRGVNPADPFYNEKIAALRNKRIEEKAAIPDVPRDPSKDYRWCDPRAERFPYLVMRGWVPVNNHGQLVTDNELILCWKDKAVDMGAAQRIDLPTLENKGEVT